jgi:hypothetical protein
LLDSADRPAAWLPSATNLTHRPARVMAMAAATIRVRTFAHPASFDDLVGAREPRCGTIRPRDLAAFDIDD